MIIPGVNTPSSITNQGTYATDSLLSGHIFGAGLEQPEVLKTLIVKYPNFWFAKLLEDIPDVTGEIESDVYAWSVLERTRRGTVLTHVSGGGTAQVVVSTNIPAAGDNLGYYRVGDVIRVAETGKNYRVINIGISGGNQTLTLVAHDGSNIPTADINGVSAGHISADFPRGSSGSGGSRVSFPVSGYNVTNIHRRGLTIERGALSQRTWIDDKSWYFPQEDILHNEFMRDYQAKLLFGKLFHDRNGVSQTKGIFTYADEAGKKVTFSGSVSESDWGNLAAALLPEQGSEDLIVLMGERIFVDTQYALRDYRPILNSEPGGNPMLAGLNFQSYYIGNKRFHFKYFDMFSDPAVLPAVTPAANRYDFRNTALVLDMGYVNGGNGKERNIQVKFRKGARFIQKFITGMASDSLEVSSAYDGLQIELLCEFTTAVLLPNRLGIVYAIA